MVFTLISVSCINHASFSLVVKGGICEIRTAKLKTIGRIPQVRVLYHVTDPGASPHLKHIASIANK